MLAFTNIVRSYEKSSRGMAELIPAMIQITPGLVLNKDGALVCAFDLAGLDLEGKEQDAFDQSALLHDQAIRAFDGRITLDYYVDHRRIYDYPEGSFIDPVAKGIDTDWKSQFSSGAQFSNRLSIAVTFRQPQTSDSFMDRVSAAVVREGISLPKALFQSARRHLSRSQEFAYTATELDGLIQSFEEMLSSFAVGYQNTRLTRYIDGALLGFLYERINPANIAQDVRITDSPIYLDTLLSASKIDVEANAIRHRGDRDLLVSAITVKDYPNVSFPGLLDVLLTTPGEFIVHHSFKFADSAAAEAHITRMAKHHRDLAVKMIALVKQATMGIEPSSYDEGRIALAQEAEGARGDLSRNGHFGWYHFAVMPIADNREELENTVSAVRKALAARQIVSFREDMHTLSSWAASIPGNAELTFRWFFFSTASLSDCVNLRTIDSGEIINPHLSEQAGCPQPALTAFSTAYNTPVYFSPHYGDLGHMIIIGPPGAGKSTFANFLLSQFGKYRPSRRYVFDKDYSTRIATLMQGGNYVDLMGQRGSRVRFNPYQMLAEVKHHTFLARFTRYLLEALSDQDITTDSGEYQQVELAIAQAAALPSEHHTLFTVASLLGDALGKRIQVWLRGNEKGHYFDNDEDTFTLNDFTSLEMGDVLSRDPEAAVAILDLAVYRISERLKDNDGAPTVIYVEEAWFMLNNPKFARIIEDWLRTLRKKNAMLWLATQALDELVNSDIAGALKNTIMTRIFLPNISADSDDNLKFYKGQFGLNDTQVSQIKNGIPKTNYLIWKPNFSRMVWAPFSPTILACVRSDPRAQKTFDQHYEHSEKNPDWKLNYIEEMCRA